MNGLGTDSRGVKKSCEVASALELSEAPRHRFNLTCSFQKPRLQVPSTNQVALARRERQVMHSHGRQVAWSRAQRFPTVEKMNQTMAAGSEHVKCRLGA